MIEKIGIVYDLRNNHIVLEILENLPSPKTKSKIMFHTLDLVGYVFEPSSIVSLLPTSRSLKEDVKKVTATVGPSVGPMATPVVNEP
jgi:hypothetical protein